MKKILYCIIGLFLIMLRSFSMSAPSQEETYADNMQNLVRLMVQQPKITITHMPIQDFYKSIDTQSQIAKNIEQTSNLSMTTYNIPILLNGTTYSDTLNGAWSEFTQPIEIYHVTLNKGARFNDSIFQEKTIFHKVKCVEVCNFSMSKFYQHANFMGSVFFDNAHFDGSTFYNDVVFLNTDFDGEATFSSSTFYKQLTLDGASFLQGLDLSYSKFHRIYLNHTQVAGYINLQHIETNDPISLLSIEPVYTGEKILLNVVGDDISKINLSYDNFKLYFPRGTDKYEIERIYRRLLEKFKSNGNAASYAKLYKEYNEHHYLQEGKYAKLFLDKHIWNFGLEKNRVFTWLAMLFLLYTFLNCIFYRNLISRYINIGFLNQIDYSPTNNLNRFQQFIFYLPYAFILTLSLCICLFLPGMGISIDNFKGRSIAVTTYLLLLPLAGFIFITFIIIFILRA